MAVWESYSQLRQAEDVQDEIYNISPIDNPVCSMSRTIQANGKIHEWSEDSLKAAGVNAKVEGAEAVDTDPDPIVEKQNYCQIMDKVAKISGTLEEVDKYGRDSEMAYQLELRYGELANDEELAVVGAPGGARQTADPGDASTARKMAAIYSQVDSGNVITSTTTTKAGLEDEILAAHQAVYTAGGNPGYAVTDEVTANSFAEFALATGRNREIRDSRTLVHVIDLYASTYGQVDVVLDRNMRQAGDTQAVLLLDFNYLATPVLRPTRDWPLAKGGDYERRQILRESTFAVLNSKAHGIVDSIDAALT